MAKRLYQQTKGAARFMCSFARCWCEVLLKNKVTIAKS
jgi:hypothetical protein